MIFVSFNSNTTGVAGRAGTANPSEASQFTSGFSGVRVAWSFVFCVVVCGSLFFLFLLVVLLSVCPSIWGFWLLVWCLQTFLTVQIQIKRKQIGKNKTPSHTWHTQANIKHVFWMVSISYTITDVVVFIILYINLAVYGMK
jgi:hypothetical protein